MNFRCVPAGVLFTLSLLSSPLWALSSPNIPLDSPVYLYLEKLAGFGLITSDVQGLKPFSRAEAARLALEAGEELKGFAGEGKNFAQELLAGVIALLPREAQYRRHPDDVPPLGWNPFVYGRARYVYLDGAARDYDRFIHDRGHQSAFGFIGGDLRPQFQKTVHQTGTEGTPLLENNEGIAYRRGSSGDIRFAAEAYAGGWGSAFVEPVLLADPDRTTVLLNKGYVKIGGGALELEIGRDANWFGPGYRGTTTLTDNARNFDMIKLSSPEPLDVKWVKNYLGGVKYAFVVSRFDETGTGVDQRQPYFLGAKLAVKPSAWAEIGVNFVRQSGGPGLSGGAGFGQTIFGGGAHDQSNSLAGLDLRFRLPWLRGTEIYGEYSGEDSASFWPFVESYVAGIFIPRLTADGRDDLRFEYFYGNPILYTDWQYPGGYVYRGMTPGHSQGGATNDFFLRYSHWFSPRTSAGVEYIHTERGNEGRVTAEGVPQGVERKDAGRLFLRLPLAGPLDLNVVYGIERVRNLDLESGVDRTNLLFRGEVAYRY